MTFFNLDQTSLPRMQKFLQVETRLVIKTAPWNCNHRKLLTFPSEVSSVSSQFLGKNWVQWLSWAKMELCDFSFKRFWMVHTVVKAINVGTDYSPDSDFSNDLYYSISLCSQVWAVGGG